MTTTSPILFWCLLSILLIVILVHLILLLLVIRYRDAPSIKASQPAGLCLMAASGAAALMGGCFLIAPPSQIPCSIAEPLIFSSITIAGATLAGMAWRVERITYPILMLGRRRRSLPNLYAGEPSSFDRMRERLMAMFTKLAYLFNRGRKGDVQQRMSLRQNVSAQSLLQLIFFLSLPQTILQLLTICLTSLRKYVGVSNSKDACVRPPDSWWTVPVGILLALLPYMSSLIITSKRKGGTKIPSVLSLDLLTKKVLLTLVISTSVAPLLAFGSIYGSVEASAYTAIYILLAAVFPPAQFISTKVCQILRNPHEKVDIIISIEISASLHKNRNNRYRHAIEALEQGHIFEEMDMPNKSLKLYTEALELWQQNDGESREFSGDFSIDEIRQFNASDGEVIADLLLAKAKLSERHAMQKAAKCYLKVIDIHEFAPGMEAIEDRSAIFPCFHALFRLLREGELEQGTAFEKGLTARFVSESKSSNSYHYACALALNAEMKANAGLTREALKEIGAMVKVYSAKKDSRAIHASGGLDICALAIAKSALWYINLDEIDSALRQCETVTNLLADMQSTDTTEMHVILTPIISIILKYEKTMTSRMLSIYERYVIQHTKEEAEMPFFVRIMIAILTLRCDNTLESDRIETFAGWLPTAEEIEVAQEVRSLGISLYTLCSEACLLIAQRLVGSSRDAVVSKGMAFTTLAIEAVDFNDYQVCAAASIAHDHNQRVQSALQLLARESGFDPFQGEEFIHAVRSKPHSRRNIRSTLVLRAKKVLPHELLLQHDTIAFVGLTHDSLAKVFQKALAEEPNKCWSSISICYMADSRLQMFVSPSPENSVEDEVEKLRLSIRDSKSALYSLLCDRVAELRLLEINDHCFFGGWFGWREEGGYIHVSPTVWGVNRKECPSQSLTWEPGTSPSHEYNSYRRGIDNILEKGSTFATEVNVSSIAEFSLPDDTQTQIKGRSSFTLSRPDNTRTTAIARLRKPRVSNPLARSLKSRSSV